MLSKKKLIRMSDANTIDAQSINKTAIFLNYKISNQKEENALTKLIDWVSKSKNHVLITLNSNKEKAILKGIENKQINIYSTSDTYKEIVLINTCNELSTLSKFLSQVAKLPTNQIIASTEKLNSKASILNKAKFYLSNVWNKIFTANIFNNLHQNYIVLNETQFENFIVKGNLSNQMITAIASDENNLVATPIETNGNNYTWAQSFTGFFTGFKDGLFKIWNTYFKSYSTSDTSSSWLNVNANQYKKIFSWLAVGLLIFMCYIQNDFNITWDEPNHNSYSKDVLKYYTSLGSDTTIFDFTKAGHRDYQSNVLYGMSIDVVSSAINKAFSIENEYYTRHLLNTITGFLAILFTALLVRIMAGWLPAIVTLLALIASPSFFGHCFNNPKDIPFAAGYIMSIYYLAKVLMEMPRPSTQSKFMLALSIGFAISIRVQGILPLVYTIMFMAMYWWFNKNKWKNFKIKQLIKTIAVIGIVGYIIGIALWPYALRSPLTAPFKALKEFENFGFLTYYELFEGVRMYQKPWYYEPKLIALTAPIIILAGFVISLLFGWIKLDKNRRIVYLLIVFATLFPAAYTIYQKSYVYNGWRHFIFIYPTLVALAIIGIYRLFALFKKSIFIPIATAIILLLLIKPILWSIKNHPYEYMYFNEIGGGVKGANGFYELDYWNQTPREAFAWLIKNKPEVLDGKMMVSSNNIQESLKTFIPEGKDVKYKWTREYSWTNDDYDYAIWTTRTLNKTQILGKYWPPKGTIYEVKVDGVSVAAVVKSENKMGALGFKMLKENKIDSAKICYQNAFENNPYEAEYAFYLGNIYLNLNSLDSAKLFMDKALELRDGNYDAYNGLGEYYIKKYASNATPDKSLLEKARTNFENSVKFKENFSGAWYNLSETCAALGDKLAALNAFAEFFVLSSPTQELYNKFTELLKQNGYAGDELEPYYFLYNKAKKEGKKGKANIYLTQHQLLING